MWQYVLLLFRRQPGKAALAGSGFLLAACALILLSAATQTTVVQGNQIISQSWRSSYDLVVLPPQAQVASKDIIAGDLLEGYDGGISMQQYEQIQKLPGIEVAAPIAYIGYVKMPVPHILFSTPSQPLTPGYYRPDWMLTAFNGKRNKATTITWATVTARQRFRLYGMRWISKACLFNAFPPFVSLPPLKPLTQEHFCWQPWIPPLKTSSSTSIAVLRVDAC